MRCCTPTIFNSLRHVTFTSGTLTFPLRVLHARVPASAPAAPPRPIVARPRQPRVLPRPRQPSPSLSRVQPFPLPFPVPRPAPRTPPPRPPPGPAPRRPHRFVPAPPPCPLLPPPPPTS